MRKLTYYEWTIELDKFAKEDDSVIEDLIDCKFALDAGTAVRFYLKINNTYSKRKQIWMDKFNQSLTQSRPKTDGELEIIFRNAKANLKPLIKFISLDGLPSDLKDNLRKDLINCISKIRNEMKDNLIKGGNKNEKLFMLINNFDLNEKDLEAYNIILDIDNNSANNLENNNTKRRIMF